MPGRSQVLIGFYLLPSAFPVAVLSALFLHLYVSFLHLFLSTSLLPPFYLSLFLFSFPGPPSSPPLHPLVSQACSSRVYRCLGARTWFFPHLRLRSLPSGRRRAGLGWFGAVSPSCSLEPIPGSFITLLAQDICSGLHTGPDRAHKIGHYSRVGRNRGATQSSLSFYTGGQEGLERPSRKVTSQSWQVLQ